MHQYVNSSNEMLRKTGLPLDTAALHDFECYSGSRRTSEYRPDCRTSPKTNPYVSLSTIYRTLELLKELGLVRENHLPGEQPHYETAEGKDHHHLVCRNCRAIIHLDNTLIG